MIALALVAAAHAEDPPPADPAPACEDTHAAEIQQIYDASEAEKADRSASAKSVLQRDEDRARQMADFDRKGWLCTPQEKWQAAWVMEQADDLPTLQRAYELAIETMKAHDPRGPWLVAFTFDRQRVSGGYRQSYGTQTRVDDHGRLCLVEVEPDVTDADRAKYGQPPLADQYRKVLDANGFTGDEPTLERLQRHDLSCAPVAVTKKGRSRVAPPPE